MSDTAKVRTLVVDDEPLARRKILALLKGDESIEVVGQCSSGDQALASIVEHKPDLVFLDVQMPEIDGFAVLEQLPPDEMPLIIFVTAYDRYALRAFEFCALDYLLKPYDRKRFQKALQQAKARIATRKAGELGRQPPGPGQQAPDLGQQTLALFDQIKSRSKYIERLPVKGEGRVFLIKSDEVDWIEAEGKYVRLHTGGQTHLLRASISAMEAELDPKKFARINRSAIVNLDRISELQPWFHNEYRVVLRDGSHLTLSRSGRKKLEEVLGHHL